MCFFSAAVAGFISHLVVDGLW